VLFISIICLASCFACFDSSLVSRRSIGPLVSFADSPFIALIVAGGINNTVLHVCSGAILNTPTSHYTSQFNLQMSFILTSTYCILDRSDPGASDKNLVYKVLINDEAGNVRINGTNFTVFSVLKRITNPDINTVKSYSVNVTIPPAFNEILNISVNVNDIGVIQLDRFIDISGVKPTTLSTEVPKVGANVHCLGYGSPDFFQLHSTDKTRIILSIDQSNNAPSTDTLFFHDGTSELSTTIPSTPLQAIETGDEGCPLVDDTNLQVGIGQATWRVQQNNSTIITFASVGSQVHAYKDYIESVLAQFNSSLAPVSTSGSPTDNTSVSPVAIQNSAIKRFHGLISSLIFITIFWVLC